MSRYDWSVLYVDKDGDFYGTRQPLRLREHDSDLFHVVTDADSKRIDLIAWKYYRDTSLWWIIADFNNINNPFEIPSGTTLRIPAYERIQMKVLARLRLMHRFLLLKLAVRICLKIFRLILRVSVTKKTKSKWTNSISQ